MLYFGVLRDRFGAADEAAELPDGATVGELLGLLRERTSNSGMANQIVNAQDDQQLWRSLAVAVNREYGSTSIVLQEGDEVALLPPVSGGTARTAGRSLREQKICWALALLAREMNAAMDEKERHAD